jgi:hypothetical protein
MDQRAADRILVARISGTARRHSRWRPLTEAEEVQAVTELAELAGGRTDLLAEVAGLQIGCYEGDIDEPRRRQAANLLLQAGADPSRIPAWIEIGRIRVRNARHIPYTGLTDVPMGRSRQALARPLGLAQTASRAVAGSVSSA